MKLLEVEALNVYYDSIHAIKNVSFHINSGEILALIGANGAGKTTILQTISRLKDLKSGQIEFEGIDITKLPAYKLVEMGLAHTPEGRRIFTDLTVLENLEMGAYTVSKKEEKKNIEKMFEIFPRLKERKNQLAGTMSGGEQQMLAIARSLMSNPKLLLLDEPSMGLAPILVSEIFKIIQKINSLGVTVLLVEQNANQSLEIADRAYVLETGEIVLEGKAKDIKENEAIKKAYLGA